MKRFTFDFCAFILKVLSLIHLFSLISTTSALDKTYQNSGLWQNSGSSGPQNTKTFPKRKNCNGTSFFRETQVSFRKTQVWKS